MKKLLLALCWFYCCQLNAQQEQQKIEEYVNARKNRGFNGTILVVHKGTVLYSTAKGWQDVNEQTKNDLNTVFRVGSLSKPFTALLILQMQDKGLLNVEDPVSKYLPDFPHGEKVKIKHLLTHSSGIKEYLEIPYIQQLPDSAPPISMDSLIGLFKEYDLSIEPGEKFLYSNSNYILLARITEKISGEKFERLVRREIFEPAGMSSSGFAFKLLDSAVKATGHNEARGKLNTIEDFDSTYAPGCGSMFTNVGDLYKFYKHLCSGNLISDSLREKSFLPVQWLYGYGWFRLKLYGRRCIAHPGGVPGFYSNLQFYPDDDLFIALLSNAGPVRISPEAIASIVFKERVARSPL